MSMPLPAAGARMPHPRQPPRTGYSRPGSVEGGRKAIAQRRVALSTGSPTPDNSGSGDSHLNYLVRSPSSRRPRERGLKP
jgi:hypothetical protein